MGKYPSAPEQTWNVSVNPWPYGLFRIRVVTRGTGFQKPEQRKAQKEGTGSRRVVGHRHAELGFSLQVYV